MATLALLFGGSAHAATPDMPAALAVIGDLPAEGGLEAAQEQLPARWRLELLKPEASPPRAPQIEIEALARAYLEADFLRCLTELQRSSLDVDRLLERGRRADATRVGTFAAACALGARDEGRARELVRRLLVRELMEPDVLRRTTPDFQKLAEEERQAAQRWGRVTVEVRTEPGGAAVQVDGITRCVVSPCRLHLLRGEHVVVTEKLGRRSRSVTTLLDEDQTLTIALDAASVEEIRRQLATTLGSGADPSGVDIARAASTAFGVALLVMTWRRQQQVHSLVYQRSGGALTHVALDDGNDAVPRAVRAGLREWRVDTGPRSMFKQPLFWSTAAGVALLTAAAVYILSRPVEVRRDIVFQ